MSCFCSFFRWILICNTTGEGERGHAAFSAEPALVRAEAANLVLCLVEDLAGSPQSGEDILRCVTEAHHSLVMAW